MTDQPGHPEEMARSSEEDNPSPSFPVVGIGASAGGLEAYEKLFHAMPSDTGMAFILVQHLDPNRESMLVELLERYTTMPVTQVVDGVTIEPDHIYVIPPNRNMAILQGKLHLMEPIAPRGLRLPIDYFFRSMADDLHERAICIILSGTGSDGTLGLKAIKGENGMAIVQAPESARYDGMPHNAISTGLVDLVLPPEEMPEHLIGYAQHAFGFRADEDAKQLQDDNLVEKVFILLRDHTGHDFSEYKPNTILRRIERRMAVNQIERPAAYIRYLQHNNREIEILFKDLLIGVTSFFRDKDAWEALEAEVIPAIIQERSPGTSIRVWVPGCSTGEEAYSLAMLFQEQLEEDSIDVNVQIFATDIDESALEKARAGTYPENIAADVPAERLNRFFIKGDNVYQIKDGLRDKVVFARQSVIKDPPFSKLDLISCRNLLIYLGPKLQEKVIPLFHYALRPDGYLFLGNSESLGKHERFFKPINRRLKLFQRTDATPELRGAMDFTSPDITVAEGGPSHEVARRKLSISDIAVDVLMEHYTAPSVIVNERYDILYFHHRTGKFLQPARGEPESNLLQMAREGLRMAVTTAVREARKSEQEVIYEGITVQTDGGQQPINLIARPIRHRASAPGLVMVVFQEVEPDPDEESRTLRAPSPEEGVRVTELEHELRSTRQHLQTTIEELETSNEELKSTNEELQSSNEELQSTNEELETAKEELQSVNEELLTVNTELESKVASLTVANNDMRNLLASLNTGIVFLDQWLNVQRFNQQATVVINLIDSDIGRPLEHVTNNLKNKDALVDAARHVLNTLEMVDVDIETEDGDWYALHARPYRNEHNAVQGVLLSFTYVTQQREQQAWRRTLERAVEQAATQIVVADDGGRVEYVNPAFVRRIGFTANDIVHLSDLIANELPKESFEEVWDVLSNGSEWHGELCIEDAEGSCYWAAASIAPVRGIDDTITNYIAVLEDISHRIVSESKLRTSEEMYRLLTRHLPHMAVLLFDHDLRYLVVEGEALPEADYDPETMEGQRLQDVAAPALAERLEPLYRRALAGETFEEEIEGRNGRYRTQFLPVTGSDGEVIAGMVVARRVASTPGDLQK